MRFMAEDREEAPWVDCLVITLFSHASPGTSQSTQPRYCMVILPTILAIILVPDHLFSQISATYSHDVRSGSTFHLALAEYLMTTPDNAL